MSVKHLSKLFVIIALTAVQFTPLRAQETATQPKVITLKVTAKDCSTRFDDLLVRVDPTFKLEVHIDTDEANACDLDHATKVELFKS